MRICCGIIILFLLTSCAFKEHNEMVERGNLAMFTAYGNAMAKQTSEGGRMAVNNAYILRVGMSPYQRPETVLDYSKGLLPYADLFMRLYRIDNPSSTGRSVSYHVEGINNTMSVSNEDGSRNGSIINDSSYNMVPE